MIQQERVLGSAIDRIVRSCAYILAPAESPKKLRKRLCSVLEARMDPNMQTPTSTREHGTLLEAQNQMIARLRNHHMVLIGLGSALAALAACSAPETAREADAKQTTQASSVVIEMVNTNGSSVGSCSGTLIGPKMVLTAGHCIAGFKSWKVRSSAGTSTGSVATTPWKAFGSDLSHPEHSDVGLILLDKEIKLDGYPSVASKVAKGSTKGLRFHRSAENANAPTATETTINLGEEKGFKLNYLVKAEKNEWVDSGGAVLNSKGELIGVVSGLGKNSGMIHVARIDNFATWTKSAIACSNGLSARTWGSGNAANGGGGYGGTPSTSSGGGGWGGWGGGGGGWGSSSGGYGGGGGKGNGGGAGMDGGATVPGSSGGANGSGTTEGTNNGGTGQPGDGTNGGASSGGADDQANTCPGIPACEGDCGAGSNGNNGGTGSNGGGADDRSGVGTIGGPGGGFDEAGNPTAGGGFNQDGSKVPASGNGQNGNSGGGFDASGNPTAGGGFNQDGSQVPAGGSGSNNNNTTGGGAGNTGGGFDANGSPTAGGGFNQNGSQVPAGGSGASSSGGGYDAKGNPTQGGGYNKDGSMVPAGGTPGSSTGQAEVCEGAADNAETCPTAPDGADCKGSTCGGCGTNSSCEDQNIDFGSSVPKVGPNGTVVN